MGGVVFDPDRLFALMERFDVGLLLASSRHNVRYLTGGYYYPLYAWDGNTKRTQHLCFVAIPLNRIEQSFFVGRPTERAMMDEAEAWPHECVESARIGSAAAVAKVAEELRARGLACGRIAAELSYLPADAFLGLADALPQATFIEASAVLDPLRAVKRPAELDAIREGLRRNVHSVDHALRSGRDGQTTLEVAELVRSEFRRRDLYYLYSLVCAGPSFFRAPSRKRTWRGGQPLHVDAGGVFEGYIAEVCRSGFLGRPSARAVDLLGSCRELSEAGLSSMRSGAAASDVQRGADEFLRSHRWGEYGSFIAHGIGLVHHEDPVVDLGSADVLEAGMVLSVEAEFRIPDFGHVKVEDTVAVTSDGYELMTPGGFEWRLSDEAIVC